MAQTDTLKTTAIARNKRTDFILHPTLRNEEFRVVDLGLAAQHQFRAVIVILTNVFEWIHIRRPSHGEYLRRPGLGVGAGIVDRRLILQGIHIRSREALGELELFRVRRATRVDPELLV